MDIIEYFYSIFVPSAKIGKVRTNKCEDVYFRFNVRIISEKPEAETLDEEENECAEIEKADPFLVPTLIIKNKQEFDSTIREYMSLAYNFYNSKNQNCTYTAEDLLVYAFVDLNLEDYNDPVKYFRRRIGFIKDNTFTDFSNSNIIEYPHMQGIGYCEALRGRLFAHEAVAKPQLETPKEFRFILYTDDNSTFTFPVIRFGIYDNTAYIYSIQQIKRLNDYSTFGKKVDRALYQINKGFDTKEDTYENYEEGNLSDVTPSFVVALTMFIGLLKSKSIENVVITPFTVVRWNNKIANNIVLASLHDGAFNPHDALFKTQEAIYRNVNEKLIRTVLRLCYQIKNVEILTYPYELDSSMHIRNSGELECENDLLVEAYKLCESYEKEMFL